MRILVLLTDLFDTVGGIETFNRCLIKALFEIAEKRSWKVTVHALNDRENERRGSLTGAEHVYKCFARNRRRFALASVYESWRADAVIIGHVHFSPLSCAMKNVPKYLVVHGIDVWRKLPALQQLGLSQITEILSVSTFTRDEMAKYNGISLDRFRIFPNTLDYMYGRNLMLQTRRDLGFTEGKMILSVSRLDPSESRKGIDKVIMALPIVLTHIPDAFYVIVGDGADIQRLEAVATDVGIRDRVTLVGRVSDELLPSYYQACDIFALPSLKEGFGIVFLEAMHHAKACVGARAGGIPEVVEEGATGFLSDPDDLQSLANSIVRLLGNDRLRHAMGCAGRERLQRVFSFEMFRQRLETALESHN